MIELYTKMFESRISAGATEKLLGGKSLTKQLSRAHTIWKDMRESVSKDVRTGEQKDSAVIHHKHTFFSRGVSLVHFLKTTKLSSK